MDFKEFIDSVAFLDFPDFIDCDAFIALMHLTDFVDLMIVTLLSLN